MDHSTITEGQTIIQTRKGPGWTNGDHIINSVLYQPNGAALPNDEDSHEDNDDEESFEKEIINESCNGLHPIVLLLYPY